MVFRFFVVVSIMFSTLYADEISELISEIQHANSSQKRLLINELKVKLKGAKASKRAEVIAKLRKGAHFSAQHNGSRVHIHIQSGKTVVSSQNHKLRGHK